MLKKLPFHYSVKGTILRLLPISLSLLVLFANPFHILDDTSAFVERLSQRGISILFAGDGGQSDVVVVAIDNFSLSQLGPETGYPLNLDVHSRLLKTIMCAAPSSIFVDVAFQRIRTDNASGQLEEDALAHFAKSVSVSPFSTECQELHGSALEDLDGSRGSVPIYLAQRALGLSGCSLFDNASVQPQGCPAASARFGKNFHTLYLSRKDEFESQLSYPLLANSTNTLRFQEPLVQRRNLSEHFPGTQPSPALALLFERCAQNLASNEEQKLCKMMQTALEETGDADINGNHILVPTWRYFRSTPDHLAGLSRFSDKGTMQSSCETHQNTDIDGADFSKKTVTLVTALLQGLSNDLWPFAGPRVFGQTNCSPYPTVTADTLLKLREACFDAGGCTELLDLFKNKSVIYGYSADATNDFIQTPVLGYVPGMILHAAAFDSLTLHGTDYKRDQASIELAGWTIPISSDILTRLFVTTYLALVILIAALHFSQTHARFGVSLLFLLFALWLPSHLNLAPVDWIVCALFFFTDMRKGNTKLTFIDQQEVTARYMLSRRQNNQNEV